MGAVELLRLMREDVEAAVSRDPAARSRLEVALLYPGVHAIWAHRAASALWQRRCRLAARTVSQVARFATGVEIHPAAQLGRRLLIDHAAGVVIGETAVVGDDVTMFHGVTLGAVSADPGRRHPRVGNGVLLGAGCVVLGPVTVGDGARVGANAVVVGDVPPGVTVVGAPARPL